MTPKQEAAMVFREIKVGEYVLRFWPSDNGWMCGITPEMMQALAEQPAIKPWVELTAMEIEELGKPYQEKDKSIQAWGLFACAVDEKLKEKNT